MYSHVNDDVIVNYKGIIGQPMNTRRVPIGQVAAAAGVSAQTVSRVVNKRPGVALETRRRVLEVIEALGYRPSRAAQALRGGGRTLGVVGFGLEYYGPSRTLVGVSIGARSLDYEMFLELVPDPENFDVEQILDKMMSNHVNGIVWGIPHIGNNMENMEAVLAYLDAAPIPLVFTDIAPQPGISAVMADNRLGGELATRHLIEQGHTVIGHITGPLSYYSARMRKSAWQETLRAHSLPSDDSLTYEGDWSAQSGAAAIPVLLNRRPDITALFIGNDPMALGALSAINRMGLAVPDDLAIVGYDDIPEAQFFQPALSSVRQNIVGMGIHAVEELVARIEKLRVGDVVPPRIRWDKPELVVRASSARGGGSTARLDQ
jgi:LacI family transcriptional regulator